MTINETKTLLPGIHQCISLTNEHWKVLDNGNLSPTGDEIIMLFHGYSESAHKIYKRMGRYLDESLKKENKKYSIIALNGLYPLPKHFPLDGQRSEDDNLIAGFAWYFYDQRRDEFLIDYKVPVQTLTSFLKQINPDQLPTSFIGYSQGGYLAPFVALEYPPTKQVMGINCSFRFDLIKSQYKEIPFILNQVQGAEDEIIDRELSHERFIKIKNSFNPIGEYTWVEGANHWLTSDTRKVALELFYKSLNQE